MDEEQIIYLSIATLWNNLPTSELREFESVDEFKK